MPLFGSSKTINKVVAAKASAGKQHGGGAATQVQARQAKARKKEIQAELARKKQEARDIRRRKLLRNPPNAGKAKKFNEKAIAAGNKRRAKAARKKAERKAARKARISGRGFWG